MMEFLKAHHVEVIVTAIPVVLGIINKLTTFYRNNKGPWWVKLLLFITEMGVIPSKGAGLLKAPLIPKKPKQ